MRSIAIVGVVAATLTTAVWAGPYGEGSGSGRCPTLLASNVYRCTVQQEGGGTSTDCFRFGSGQVSAKFEFASDLLGSTVGCACRPSGNPAAPEYNASAEFTCATGVGVAFAGRVNGDGSIGAGSVTNAQGGTYAFSCVRDDACSTAQ